MNKERPILNQLANQNQQQGPSFNHLAKNNQEKVEKVDQIEPQAPDFHINQQSKQDQKDLASEQNTPPNDQKPSCIKEKWNNLNRRYKICLTVTTIIILLVIILIPIMVNRYVISPQKFDYQKQRIVSYGMPTSGQRFALVPVTVTKRKLFGQNEVYEGHYVIFKQANETASSKIRVMVVMTDNQTGITVKLFNGSNHFIVEVDPKQLMKFYYKNYKIQAKRLLAEAALTEQTEHDHIESTDQIESPDFAREMLQFLATELNMTDVDTELVLQQQYKGYRTAHGYEIKHKKSTLFDNPSTKRNLGFLKKAFKAVTKPFTNLVKNTVGLFKSPPKTQIITTTTTTTTNTNITNVNNTNITTTNINTGQGNVAVGNNNTVSNPQSQTNITNNKQQTVQKSKQQTKKVQTKSETEMVFKRKVQNNQKSDGGLDFEKDGFDLKTIRAGAKCTQIEGGKRCAPEEWLNDHSPYEVVGDRRRQNKVGDDVYVFSSSQLLQLLSIVKSKHKQ